MSIKDDLLIAAMRVLPKNAIAALLLSLVLSGFAVEPERSVIQILTYRQEPDWSAPWRFEADQS